VQGAGDDIFAMTSSFYLQLRSFFEQFMLLSVNMAIFLLSYAVFRILVPLSDLVQMKELAVIFAKISFIREHFLYGVIGVTTAGDTEREVGAVMMGSRGHFRGQNKPIISIDGGVLFKSEVGDIIFYCPVRLDIPGEFENIPVFIEVALGCFALLFFFFQLFLAYVMTGGLNQTGVNSDAFVDC
jgi:hypothetical protein